MRITLGAEGRRALRAAIVNHAEYNGGLNMAEATKEELLTTAGQLGIDVSQFAVGGERQRAVRPPAAPVAVPLDAAAAVTGQVVAMPRAAGAPASHDTAARKVPKLVGRKTIKDLFGVDLKAGNGKQLTMSVYDGTEAPEVDPKYRWAARASVLHWVTVAEASGMPLWLAGPPGTGKTSFVRQFAAKTGRPFVRINLDSGIERYELIGGERVRRGDVVYQDGILTQALRIPGCVILLDEPGFGRPEYMSALHAILEKEGVLTITETGEVIKRAEGVLIFAADNSTGNAESAMSYSGVREQNKAMIDRWVGTVLFDYLPIDEEVALLTETVDGITHDTARYLIEAVGKMRTAAAGGVLSEPPSWRRIESWAWALVQGIDPENAFLGGVATRQDSLSCAALMKLFNDSIDTKVVARLLKGKTLDEVRTATTNGDDDPAF